MSRNTQPRGSTMLKGERSMGLRMSLVGVVGLVASSLLLTGCSKPPPPPPPPPPAPVEPPPPADVSMDTIIQDAKVDPRVQAASGMVVTEDRVSLATAVAKLADAIAKGDEKAMESMLTPKAQSVLSSLVSSGEWGESTKGIEAVRIVLIRSGVNLSGMSATPDIAGEIDAKLASVPEAQRTAIKTALGSMRPEQILKMLEENRAMMETALQAAGASEDQLSQIIDGTKSAIESIASASSAGGDATGVLLAVQDPTGAYLLGWEAVSQGEGGTWKFGNAPSMPEVRARASSFDGTGVEGFQEVQLSAAPPVIAPPPEPDGSGGGGSGGGGGGSPGSTPSAPSSPGATPPSRKSTPSGPVTVPGSPRSE